MLTNERLLKAEQALYITQNTAEVNTQRIDLLAYKSIDSEARQRRNNLIFWGITESLNEDSSLVLAQFLSEHLSLDADAIFVQRAHRIGKFKRQRPGQSVKHRPLIACFRDYPDVELILSNANKLQGTRYGINRDYPREIIDARKPLFEEKKRLKSQNPNATISIQYPAKLVMNGRVIKDKFPQWLTVMRSDRLDMNGYIRSADSNDIFETSSDMSDMEQDEPRPSSQRSVSASPSLRRNPSSSASVAPIVADGIMGGQIRSTEPDRIREGTDGNGNGDSNATDHRPPDSDA